MRVWHTEGEMRGLDLEGIRLEQREQREAILGDPLTHRVQRFLHLYWERSHRLPY